MLQPQISWVLSAACQPGYGKQSMVMTTVYKCHTIYMFANVLNQATYFIHFNPALD